VIFLPQFVRHSHFIVVVAAAASFSLSIAPRQQQHRSNNIAAAAAARQQLTCVHIFVDTLTQFLIPTPTPIPIPIQIPIPMRAEAHTGINIIMVASLHFLAAFRASAFVFPPFLAGSYPPPRADTRISIINYRPPIGRYSALCSMAHMPPR